MSFKPNELPWSDAERTFCAESSLTNILPNFSFGILSLISGDYGPFIPSKFIKVPLWLASHLKKSSLCSVICPEWMETDELERCLRDEIEFEDTFYSLPFYWQEISTIILSVSGNDLSNIDEVRKLLQRIKEIRANKLDAGLKEIDSRPLSLKNIGCAELNRIKPFLIATADQLSQFSNSLQTAQRIRAPEL